MLYFPDGYRLNDTMYFVPAHTGTKSHQYTMSEVQPASLLVTEATEACLVLNVHSLMMKNKIVCCHGLQCMWLPSLRLLGHVFGYALHMALFAASNMFLFSLFACCTGV